MSDPIDPAPNQTSGLKQKLMSNKTPLLIIALVIATVVLVGVALIPGKDSTSNPAPTGVESDEVMAETSLSLSEVYEGESEDATGSASISSSDIQIETGSNKVTGVQLEIKYNPALLTEVEILPGGFFDNPTILLEKIDTEAGIVSYALGTESEGITGQGVVATLSFTPRPGIRGETSLEFLSKTAVSAEGADKSVLMEVNGLEFTLSSESVTSPSAQPSSE
jgi:hypothetical protein